VNLALKYLCLLRVSLCFSGLVLKVSAVQTNLFPYAALREIPFSQVRISGPFWSERIRTVQEVTIPDLLTLAEEQGKIDNFRIVAGRKAGKYRTCNAADSDVYKLIEDAAYSLAWRRNPQLEKRLDTLIADIVAAQQPGGYLNTQFTLSLDDPAAPARDAKFVKTFGFGPDARWQSRAENWPFAYSQLYCAGHLMEAAVAYFRAAGKRELLDAAIRNADHIGRIFTLEKIKAYADHPEVEIGLMKLYEVTGTPRYLELADQFARYVRFSRPVDLNKEANSKPLVEQDCAFGHCVRTAYIYTGATEVTRATGADDLRAAMFALSSNVVGRKMYLTGGTGNGTTAEQHGRDFDLPIGATYSETCAAVAQGEWNHSLNLLAGDARFADLVELESWNNALAGIGLDGTNYFYANKINLGTDGRKDEHSGVRRRYLFCCPSKVPGFVSGIGRWIYAQDERGLTINQFIGSEMTTTLAGGTLRLKQDSSLPWAGRVVVSVKECPTNRFALRLRVPAWVNGGGPIPGGPYRFGNGEKPKFKLLVNGKSSRVKPDAHGYLVVERVWQSGAHVELQTTMPVRRVHTDDHVAANQGRVALMRGPLVYCLEGADNDFNVLEMELPAKNKITSAWRGDLMGGMTVLRGQGKLPDGLTVNYTAVPYFAWQNRGVHALATMLIENRKLVQPENPPARGKVNTNG